MISDHLQPSKQGPLETLLEYLKSNPWSGTRFLMICLLVQFTLHHYPVQAIPSQKIDSLLRSLELPAGKEERITQLNQLSEAYFTVDPGKGVEYGLKSLQLGLTHNKPVLVALAYHHIAGNYYFQNNYIEAIKYYWAELKWSEKHKLDAMTGKSYHGIALTYFNQKDYEKAILYFSKALAAGQKTNDHDLKIGCTANLAMAYEAQNRLKDALKNYQACMDMAVEARNKGEEGYMCARIGWVYYLMGDYPLALKHQFKSYSITKKLSNQNNIAAILSEISTTYRGMLNFPAAIGYMEKSIETLATSNTNLSIIERCSNYLSLANLHLEWGAHFQIAEDSVIHRSKQVEKSISYFKKSIALARQTGQKNSLSLGYEGLSRAYQAIGNSSMALKFFKKHIAIRDSLNNIDKEKESARQEFEYAFQKKKDSIKVQSTLQQAKIEKLEEEKKIASLTIRQQWLFGIIVFILLAFTLTITYFILKSRQLKLQTELELEKKEKIIQQSEMEQNIKRLTFKAIQSQMNPHFLFNTLNTIQHYVYNNEKEKAAEYLGKFSHLIRQILAFSNQTEVTLEEEIEMISAYMELEIARFGPSLLFKIDKDPSINLDEILIPPLLIQPYVENAIKHGLMHCPTEKRLDLKIRTATHHESVFVHVIDNGIGRTRSKALQKDHQPENHASFAMEANARRIDLLNHRNENKERLRIVDLVLPDGSPSGTEIILEIPV